MLLFLNLDCVFTPPADSASPPPGLGMAGLAALLRAWPRLRVVIASEHRYRMTIEQLRGLFPAALRHQVLATTLIYGGLSRYAALSREQEIVDWLRHADDEGASWLALDHRVADFQVHADRLVACTVFTEEVAAELQARLLQCALPPVGAWAGRPGPAWQAGAVPG